MNRNLILVLIGFIFSLISTALLVYFLIDKRRKMALSSDIGPVQNVVVTDQIVIEQASPFEPDDLTKISGIGPKTASALQGAGIMRFSQLAELDDDTLQEILDRAGVRITVSEAWREQAVQEVSGS